LFTDGYPDQFGGPKGKKLKYKQFCDLLVANCQSPPSEQANALKHFFNQWKGNLEQVDDVCVIGVKI
jgi:serine phosphatase RsbU (regulator of sigma subunit)